LPLQSFRATVSGDGGFHAAWKARTQEGGRRELADRHRQDALPAKVPDLARGLHGLLPLTGCKRVGSA